MKNISLIFAFIFFTGFYSLHAQSVDEIVNKHIEAIGGKQLLSSLQSVRMENKMEVMGNEATTFVTILNGKCYKTESEIMGSKLIQVVKENGGWMVNPMGGGSEPQDIPEEAAKQAQNNLYIVPLLNYGERGMQLVLEGKEAVNNAEAFKFKVTNKDGNTYTLFIDATNYYLVKSIQTVEVMGQTLTNTVTYSDFKKLENGWVLAYTTNQDTGGMFQVKTILSKVEVNPTIDPAIFEKKQ